jgi:heat shock protein HtpX
MAVFVGVIGALGWVVSAINGNSALTPWIVGGAAIYALLQYFMASKLAVMSTGAHEIQKRDNPRLYRVVENIAITDGLPMPKVYIIDDPAPNAFATGRDPRNALVCATTGILDVMTDRELTAVMAHEMAHVKNYDIRVSMIAFGLASAIGIISDMALRMMWFGGNDRDSRDVSPIVMVVGVIVILLAPIVALLIQMAISRQREYLADASGSLTTRDPEGLARALEKLVDTGRPMQRQSTSTAHLFFSNPLASGKITNLFSTHPPLEDRIARLRGTVGKF